MYCPNCKHDGLKTTDTRNMAGVGLSWAVRRKRYCEHCRKSFDTFELKADDLDFMRRQALTVTGLKQLLEGSESQAPAARSRIPNGKK